MTTTPTRDVTITLPDENGIWSGVHEYQLSEGPAPQDANDSMHESCWLWVSPQEYKLVEVTVISGVLEARNGRTGEMSSLGFLGVINGQAVFGRSRKRFEGFDRERFAYNIEAGDKCYFAREGLGYTRYESVRLRCWYDIAWWRKLLAEVKSNPAPYVAVAVAVLALLFSTILGIASLVLGG